MLRHKRVLTIVFAIIIAVIAWSTASAQDKEKIAGLSGTWKINLGDNMKFAKPEYNDEDWDEIYVPSNWHAEGFRNYHGYAWYRRTFKLEYSQDDVLYLELGKIDDVDEVYLNGHLIGRTGGFPPDYYTAWNYARKYVVPTEHLNKGGKNVIAVRVFDEGGEGGILGRTYSSIGIYRYSAYSNNSFALFGKWKFHLGDNEAWSAAAFDDQDWEDMIVPATWETQGYRHYDGFAWYRKSFELPENFKSDDLVLLLGKIDDMDEVFINGKLVGHTGKIERRWAENDEYARMRTYYLDGNVLLPGKVNTIAVRVYDQTGNGGIYEGPVVLLPENEYRDFWRDYRSDYSDFFGWFGRWLD